MTYRDIPNLISVFRIVMVLPVVLALLYGYFVSALVMFAIAGISDGLDGYIAKRYNCESRLGSILDPLADKLLLVSTYLALAWLDVHPLWGWLVLAVVLRDGLIILGAAIYQIRLGTYEVTPTIISKVNTCAQIILGILMVFNLGFLSLPFDWINWAIYCVFVTTILSGLDYLWIWGHRFKRKKHSTFMFNL